MRVMEADRNRSDSLRVLFAPETSNLGETTRAIKLLAPELSEAEADQLIAQDQGRRLRHPFTTNMVRERVASKHRLIAVERTAHLTRGGERLSRNASAGCAGESTRTP